MMTMTKTMSESWIDERARPKSGFSADIWTTGAKTMSGSYNALSAKQKKMTKSSTRRTVSVEIPGVDMMTNPMRKAQLIHAVSRNESRESTPKILGQKKTIFNVVARVARVLQVAGCTKQSKRMATSANMPRLLLKTAWG